MTILSFHLAGFVFCTQRYSTSLIKIATPQVIYNLRDGYTKGVLSDMFYFNSHISLLISS